MERRRSIGARKPPKRWCVNTFSFETVSKRGPLKLQPLPLHPHYRPLRHPRMRHLRRLPRWPKHALASMRSKGKPSPGLTNSARNAALGFFSRSTPTEDPAVGAATANRRPCLLPNSRARPRTRPGPSLVSLQEWRLRERDRHRNEIVSRSRWNILASVRLSLRKESWSSFWPKVGSGNSRSTLAGTGGNGVVPRAPRGSAVRLLLAGPRSGPSVRGPFGRDWPRALPDPL